MIFSTKFSVLPVEWSKNLNCWSLEHSWILFLMVKIIILNCYPFSDMMPPDQVCYNISDSAVTVWNGTNDHLWYQDTQETNRIENKLNKVKLTFNITGKSHGGNSQNEWNPEPHFLKRKDKIEQKVSTIVCLGENAVLSRRGHWNLITIVLRFYDMKMKYLENE